MNRSPDRLYELIPVVHRIRDAERGYPLRGLAESDWRAGRCDRG